MYLRCHTDALFSPSCSRVANSIVARYRANVRSIFTQCLDLKRREIMSESQPNSPLEIVKPCKGYDTPDAFLYTYTYLIRKVITVNSCSFSNLCFG